MTRSLLRVCLLVAPLPWALSAQHWEVGAGAGYGFYRDVSVTNGTLNGATGFKSGVAVTAVFGNETTSHIGGEARYTYQNNALRVSSDSTRATAGGDSHAVHYDFLVYGTPREAAARPFVAVGAGVKYYRGTGAEPVYQPGSNLVVLTHTSEVQPLISAGGGIKFPLAGRALLRLDFRDYMTPFPSDLLALRAGVHGGGWMHDFVFMVGISGLF